MKLDVDYRSGFVATLVVVVFLYLIGLFVALIKG